MLIPFKIQIKNFILHKKKKIKLKKQFLHFLREAIDQII